MNNNIIWLTCTHGRVKCLQRNIRCFLDQTYEGNSIMYICNSGDPFTIIPDYMEVNIPNKKIVIDNCQSKNFQSVGDKYNYALEQIVKKFPTYTVLCSSDDDDIFMPNHLEEGDKGINKAYIEGKLAYKPQYSYFRYRDGDEVKITRNENTYEPSIFVDIDYLKLMGFDSVSIKYHQKWLDPLIIRDQILVHPLGVSTLVYNWGDNWDTYKMSGSGVDNQNNFNAHQRRSLDMGNGLVMPNPSNKNYYMEVYNYINNPNRI